MLATALFIGCHGVIQRWMFRDKRFSQREVLIWQNVVAAGIFLAVALSTDFGVDPLAQHNLVFWGAISLTTIANIGIQSANAYARGLAEVSLTSPIQALTPALVTVAALLLKELPSAVGVVGILMISFGIFVHLNESAEHWRDYLRPFKLWRLPPNYPQLGSEEKRWARNNRRALILSYVSAVLGTVGLLGDSVSSRTGNVAIGFTVHLAVLALVFAVVLPRNHQLSLEVTKPVGWRYWLPVVAAGAVFALVVLLPLIAFRFAPVAYVGSLKRLGILATVILGWLFLGEVKAKRRLIPATIVVIGAMLLFFDPASRKIVEAAAETFK